MHLGVGDNTLLELRQDKHARHRSFREAGLFHTAFLLPSRPELARWINYAIEQTLPVAGASDHDVSEALYLSDPEGKGVEIYADRPASTWVWKDGRVRMGSPPRYSRPPNRRRVHVGKVHRMGRVSGMSIFRLALLNLQRISMPGNSGST